MSPIQNPVASLSIFDHVDAREQISEPGKLVTSRRNEIQSHHIMIGTVDRNLKIARAGRASLPSILIHNYAGPTVTHFAGQEWYRDWCQAQKV
jgi:hypothetical protein